MKMLSGACMAKTKSQNPAICDAGPVIHLDELNSLELLSDFNPLLILKTVQAEIIKHRPKALQHTGLVYKVVNSISPQGLRLSVLSKALSLDMGELESLSLAQEMPGIFFLTDDAAARLAAEELGCKVHGTVGIILRAIRKKIRTPREVIDLLKLIPTKTTLFLRPTLLKEIIVKIETEYAL